MADDFEEEGESTEKAADLLRMVDVCRLLGRSRKQCLNYVDLGYFEVVERNGQKLYTRSSVESAREALSLDKSDNGSVDLIRAQAELIRSMGEREKVLLEHERLLVRGRDESFQQLFSLLTKELVDQRNANADLFTKAQEGLDTRQVREMAQISLVTKTNREDQAMAWVERIFGEIITQIRASGGAAKIARELPAEMVEFLKTTLSPDNFDILMSLRRGKSNGVESSKPTADPAPAPTPEEGKPS